MTEEWGTVEFKEEQKIKASTDYIIWAWFDKDGHYVGGGLQALPDKKVIKEAQ